MEIKHYRNMLNILYFIIILYEIFSYKNINFIKGVCYHRRDIVNTIYIEQNLYYINNCTFIQKNYSNVCLLDRYIEDNTECYMCNTDNNLIYIRKYSCHSWHAQQRSCNIENLIHNIFFYVFIILIINLFFVILQQDKQNNKRPKKNIKSLSYNKNNLHQDDVCSICLTNYEDNYNFVIKTNCSPINHIFCYSCSKKWFNNNMYCPYCRQIVIEFI